LGFFAREANDGGLQSKVSLKIRYFVFPAVVQINPIMPADCTVASTFSALKDQD
jgi:hypothetical protein